MCPDESWGPEPCPLQAPLVPGWEEGRGRDLRGAKDMSMRDMEPSPVPFGEQKALESDSEFGSW